MNKILVIGYGNTVRGDDAAGIQAAELIAKRHPEIQSICMHQLMPEMAEQISECDIVFFVDADANASKVSARLVEPTVETGQPRSHFITPESLLSLSLQLYQRKPSRAYVIGIPASNFEFSEELSARTLSAVEDCVKEVEKLAGL
jgi:hydrogenase maturation protease